MIAITTNSSISVKPRRNFDMARPPNKWKWRNGNLPPISGRPLNQNRSADSHGRTKTSKSRHHSAPLAEIEALLQQTLKAGKEFSPRLDLLRHDLLRTTSRVFLVGFAQRRVPRNHIGSCPRSAYPPYSV